MNKPLRLLLVEDDPAARAVMRALLEDAAGLELCAEARDGMEGLELLDALEPDAVLLDLIMPGLDGVGFLRALADRPPPKRPVVIVTSRVSAQNVVRYVFSLGADYYLIKPVNVSALPGLLDALCARPLEERARSLLKKMGASGRGAEAAAWAAGVLAGDREGTLLLKQAYAGFIARQNTSAANVEKNIRDMVARLHAAAHPDYLALMGGLPGRCPSNERFLRRLAEKVKQP